ncbi:1-aminocyclopropane-1-carboxylate deaminase/D-cysteine desulfhydrase [Nitrincola tapanii]|uniref:Pyridoxal-phosphate dependent enzyme n=1 Tax=Nitrincola tapanii TaxID=1708751 RepID=A0A5A9W8B8_9GAMM|nr:hypothetical protein [Nitrincola tapanii]KAA0875721.1 hypothetical protein E1H14_03260 [Nitrincola tapanii]
MQSDSVYLQRLSWPVWQKHGITVDVLRLDRLDELISGNKAFKLQPWSPPNTPQRPLLSFGGAWSNHLHALAAAGQRWGVSTWGIVRGEPPATAHAAIQDLERMGMQLMFIDRETYRRREEPAFRLSLQAQIGEFELIPEGGNCPASILACQQIWSFIPDQEKWDVLVCAMGTGATLAGLISGRGSRKTQLLGISSLKISTPELEVMVRLALARAGQSDPGGWQVQPSTLRYGALNGHLASLFQRSEALGLPLDPIYTLRALDGLLHRVLAGELPVGSKVLLLHTGGLQGVRGQRARIECLSPAFQGPMPL